jgi:hypothetical protein
LKRFLFDKIFILKPRQTIPESVSEEAVESANRQAEIKITSWPFLADVYIETAGSFYTSGILPKRPREEKVARFGVAWFTDGNERKHVRVIADIKNAKYHSSNGIWPLDLSPHQLVYPNVYINFGKEGISYRAECSCGTKGTIEELRWNGLKCGHCQDVDEFHEENGYTVYVPGQSPRRSKK